MSKQVFIFLFIFSCAIRFDFTRGDSPNYYSDDCESSENECNKHEEYVNCLSGQCVPKKCSELGFPVKCPRVKSHCEGGCMCIDGYVWDDNGVCVKKKKCRTGCGGDVNAEPGCGTYCGQFCPTADNSTRPCSKLCSANGCQCKKRFRYDENLKKCVKRNKCTIKCPSNEYYSSCKIAECRPLDCSQLGVPIACPFIINCTNGGCVCNQGYARNDKGICIPIKECPTCNNDPNAVSGCGNCNKRCEDYNTTQACPLFCQLNGCDCKENYLYDTSSKRCVLLKDCPKKNCGINEQFLKCPANCPGENCDIDPSVVLCLPSPQPGDESCEPDGCRCNDGFCRKNGTCVPRTYPRVCLKPKEKFVECPPSCPGESCDIDPRVIKCARPPQPGDINCAEDGCRCESGYCRNKNGDCVKRVFPPTQGVCPINESFQTCPANCPGERCDIDPNLVDCARPPQPGDSDCEPDACRCNDGYCRQDGTCVRRPTSCDNDPNAVRGCGNYCNKTCSDYGKSKICPRFCKVNGCDCKKNYAYDTASKRCVLLKNCPKCKKSNEEFVKCPPSCPGESCDVDPRTVRCADPPKPGDPNCPADGCRCKSGFCRDKNGDCVIRKQPPQKCGENQEFVICPFNCPGENCGIDPRLILCQRPPQPGDPNCLPDGCRCKPGFCRTNGKCISRSDSNVCKGSNEVWVDCPDNCSPQTCRALNQSYSCPLKPQNPRNCKGACRCIEGYYRNSIGDCISEENCLKCQGPNEFYSCGGACDNVCRTLTDQNQTNCPIVNIVCNKMCYCEDGYARNDDGICVPFKDCEPNCKKPNEEFKQCPASCPGESCSIDPRTVRCATPPKPGDPNCAADGCKCKPGYCRDKNGNCVIRQSPPRVCNRENEIYVNCPDNCPPQTCRALNKTYHCPLKPIYLDESKCKGACMCIKGYYRNSLGECISKKNCLKCQGPNEYYSCGGACDNVCRTLQYQNQTNCAINNIVCNKMCYCDEGYARNDDGICVPFKDCKPNCKKPNEEFKQCPASCPGESCSIDPRTVRCATPPKPGDPNCAADGCKCKPGYCRDKNGNCVIRQSPPRVCNRENEIYVNCPDNCPPQTCKALNHTYSCPAKPSYVDESKCKGACMCIKGYLRNSLGECISEENCLKCQGPNEYYSCGGACDNVCRSLPYQNQTNCPIINIVCNKMCYCDKGYARNDFGVCVPFKDCEPPCAPNEEFLKCKPTCPNDTCIASTRRKASCPLIFTKRCLGGCACKPDYKRNANNECVPSDKCPSPTSCPEGENLSQCPPADPCDGEYCPSSRDSPQSCPPSRDCGKPQCVCGFNKHRERNSGKCIPTSQCPPFLCKGPNEQYQSCPAVCPGENCTDYINNHTCPKFRIGIVVPCRPQCKCIKNHYRDIDGTCIPAKQCAKCNKQNEEFVQCPPPCPGESCDIDPRTVRCTTPPQPGDPNCPADGCRCQSGYCRDKNDNCVIRTEPNPDDCDTPTTNPPSTNPPSTDAPSTNNGDLEALSRGNSKYTFDFYAELARQKPGTNLISSPLSTLFPIALLCSFSEDPSQSEMLNILGLENVDEIKDSIRLLINEIQSQISVVLSLAFKLYVNILYSVTDEFEQTAVINFDSEVENIGFSNKQLAADTINEWVKNKTNNLIQGLVSPSSLSDDTRLVIVNAIYFKGDWERKFNEKNTQKQDFFVDEDTVVQKDTMYQKGNFKYGESDELGCQMLELYYKGRNMSMLILLPNEKYGLADLQKKLVEPSLLENAAKKMSNQMVQVHMVKVKIETEIDLSLILKSLGVKQIFDTNDSGLVGISKTGERLSVTKATQKAFIEIYENGSVAAAANAIVVGATAALPPTETKIFNVDHGFVFILQLGNIPIFIGSVAN